MRSETEQALIREVLALHAAETTSLAEDVLRIPAAHYVSAEHAERERRDWLLGQPHLAALAGELPDAGDYVAYEIGGVPIVVVRGPDGKVRAFENVCRHRAAPVARGRGHGARVLTCPFHGWSYDAGSGALRAQPGSCEGFVTEDESTLGLRRLASREQHGLVIVDPRPEAREIDVDGWLAGLAPEIASNDYGDYLPFRSRVDRWPCNWKLLLDTYFESYHVFSLHRKSLAADYLGIASTAHAFGAHNRLVVPMRSILGLAEQPPAAWSLAPHAVVQYFVAPDVILSHYHGVLAMTRFAPISADETEVTQALLTSGAVGSEAERRALDRRFEFAHAILGDEDFPESVRVHRSLASGRVESTLVGRNERGVAIFHGALARRLGDRGPTAPSGSGLA
jgi:phenylpropionate dioxygenase-like ring-hydroxylating dioxygenase large terminal subunit